MTAASQQVRARSRREPEPEVVEPPVTDHALVDDAADWLDEIDAVLEQNDAEKFVRNFVQKGGE